MPNLFYCFEISKWSFYGSHSKLNSMTLRRRFAYALSINQSLHSFCGAQRYFGPISLIHLDVSFLFYWNGEGRLRESENQYPKRSRRSFAYAPSTNLVLHCCLWSSMNLSLELLSILTHLVFCYPVLKVGLVSLNFKVNPKLYQCALQKLRLST